MSDQKQSGQDPQSLFETWMKTASDYWQSSFRAWTREASDKSGQTEPSRARESMEAMQKTLRTLSAVMEEPESVRSLFGGIASMPEIILRMIQSGWMATHSLQQQWLERTSRLGQSTAAYNFENLDKEAMQAWSEIYDKEFRQYLKIPQLGLFRVYQERASQFVDKQNSLQTAMGEFLFMIYLPVENSLKVMQDQLAKTADEGSLPSDPKEYYRMWIKILEGHYMTLFKSPEYTQVLGKTLESFSEYTQARRSLLEDTLQSLPVPTQTEMDELYREIYQLKKRVKKLEKEKKIIGTIS